MEQTLRRLSIRMETSGTATLIENTKLYKGGYAFVGLRAFVPVTQNRVATNKPLCTVHGVITDSFGNRVQITDGGARRFWNMRYVEATTINGFEFLVFERLMPKPLTDTVGDLDLVYNYSEITADGKLSSRLATNTLRTTVGEGGEADGEIDVDLNSLEAAQLNQNTLDIAELQVDFIGLQNDLDNVFIDAQQQITLAISAHNINESAHNNLLQPIRNRLDTAESDIAMQAMDLSDTNTALNQTTIISDEAQSLALSSFSGVSYTAATGVLTFTRNNGAQANVDLPLASIISSGFYDTNTQEIVLVMVSGEDIRIPATDLVDDYFGSTGENIDITISATNVIAGALKAGSITEDKLSVLLLSKINDTPTLLSQLTNDMDFADKALVNSGLMAKQDILVSSVNIKTIGGESLLGEGDILLSVLELGLIVDTLLSTESSNALSANQGRILKELVDGKADFAYVDTAAANALNLANANTSIHTGNMNNPHNTNAEQVGAYTKAEINTDQARQDTNIAANAQGVSNNAQVIEVETTRAQAAEAALATRVTTLEESNMVVYGIRIDTTNPNPSTAVTYTDDAVGMTASSGRNGNYRAGDLDLCFPWNKVKPCLIKDGILVGHLNATDFTKFEGGDAADITSGNAGDVMIEIPHFWYKVARVGNFVKVKVSNAALAGYTDFAFSYKGVIKNQFYVGAYLGNVENNKLRSISGVMPTGNKTIGQFRTAAQANGAGYEQLSFNKLTALQVLFAIQFGGLNSQLALGQGYTRASAHHGTGANNQNGMFHGTNKADAASDTLKFLGIEDFWGNFYQLVDGYVSASSGNSVNIADGNFNDTGAGYTNFAVSAMQIGGYMRDITGDNNTGFTPRTVGGSSSTYYSDNSYLNAGALPIFGGFRNDGTGAGAFHFGANDSAAYAASYIGARLLFCG